MPIDKSQLNAVLREDFYAFAHGSFIELNPQAPFQRGWHLELIASKLQKCFEGKIRRLIVNVPPRHLKSHLASIALPAWWLGRNPSARILCVSYGQDLSDKLSRDCRTLMGSAFYQELFKTRLSVNRQAVAEFTTTEQGYRLATSVGGVVTGRGADVIIIDDPLKPDEAVSTTFRERANNFYDGTLYTRLDEKARGCIIIIMQRLRQDDLVGHVLAQESWDHVCLPAIAEEDETWVIETTLGHRKVTRRAGEALHPERESRETLEKIRETIGAFNFSGQYQQAPMPVGGGMIRADWFRTYEPHQEPERFDQVVQSWDTANKPGELADYSVCTTWGCKDKRIYLRNVCRKRMGYPELKRAVREQAQLFGAETILVEDRASGTQLIQELATEGLYLSRYEPDCDKVMRMHAQTAMIEAGAVYLPAKAHWLDDYLGELTSFPKSKFDDQVDSTSQALDWIKRGMQEPGLLTYYKERVAERKRATTEIWKVKPPQAVSVHYGRNGEPTFPNPDGSFDLPKDDAISVMGARWTKLEPE